MPNFLQSAANMFFTPANWLNRVTSPPPPTSLFQTRITHTPGGIAPLNADISGAYAPNVDPQQVARLQSQLTPQEQSQLAAAWAPLGKGFITAPQDVVTGRPDVMRHEQLHDLQQKAGLGQYAPQIAAAVNPDIVDMIKSIPVYQQEIKKFGEAPTIADEGSAIDLINMGRPNPQLQDTIMQHLKTSIQRKQFQKLTQRPDQSQK